MYEFVLHSKVSKLSQKRTNSTYMPMWPKLSPTRTDFFYNPKCPRYRQNLEILPAFQSVQFFAKTYRFFLHSKVPKVINETHLFLSHSKVFKVSQKRTHFPYRPKCPSCRQNVHIPLIFSLFFFSLSFSLSVFTTSAKSCKTCCLNRSNDFGQMPRWYKSTNILLRHLAHWLLGSQ